jgi:recombination protein RecT
MSAEATAVQTQQPKQAGLSGEIEALRPEIAKVLPAHVTPDKFMRVVMTAIAQSPDLRNADRRSLLTSCVKAAQDGLIPDGREAALVIFSTKEKVNENGRQVEHWIKKVQYMPMVAGILKKVRNSGELTSIMSNVVYEQDAFDYWVDDVGEHVTHKPNVLTADRGKLLAVYAIAKTKDGGVYVEVMSRSQIEQVKNVSKSGNNGPWGSWYDEMARKTVIRRLSKRLPMSTDLEEIVRRDDELYDLNQRRTATGTGTGRDAAKALLGLPVLPDADDAAAAGATEDETVDTTTGEVIEHDAGEQAQQAEAAAEEPKRKGK